jgi:hypothetical protein
LKVKNNGTYKARLVVCGNRDTWEGETFSPTTSRIIIWIVMSLIVLLNLFVITIDITAAFVTEAIQREVYVEVRDIDGKIRLAKLLKYLYGLDDSPKAFHDGLVKHLLAHGYSQSIYDPCLFHK